MREESNNRLPLVEKEDGAKSMHIRFNENATEREDGQGNIHTVYSYDHVRVEKNAGKGEIIDAIVRYKYSQSQMEAIVNNYLRTDRTAEQEEAFAVMQDWRAGAKIIADEVLSATSGEE